MQKSWLVSQLGRAITVDSMLWVFGTSVVLTPTVHDFPTEPASQTLLPYSQALLLLGPGTMVLMAIFAGDSPLAFCAYTLLILPLQDRMG